MKKFISVILAVILVTLGASVTAFAEEADVYTPPVGMDILYATDLTGKNVPVVDGSIGADEYGKVAKIVTDPFKMAEKWPENIYIIDEDSDRPSSGTIEYYFAYDENSIYIAFKEYGMVFDDGSETHADYAMRCNYGIEFGFDLADISNYFLHVITYGGGCWNKDLRFSDGKSANFSSFEPTPEDLYSEFFVNKYAAKDASLPDDERSLFAFGDLLSAQNTNSTEPYIIEVEMRIDKAQAIELYNSAAYTNYAGLPDAMYFSMGTHVYRPAKESGGTSLGGFARYLASDMRGTNLEDYMSYGILPGAPQECLPYLIVFGDENTVLTIPAEKPETEAVVTEQPEQSGICEGATETIASEENTVADETEAPAESGCGGAVSLASLALVAALGACTVFVSKKKDD